MPRRVGHWSKDVTGAVDLYHFVVINLRTAERIEHLGQVITTVVLAAEIIKIAAPILDKRLLLRSWNVEESAVFPKVRQFVYDDLKQRVTHCQYAFRRTRSGKTTSYPVSTLATVI